MARTLGMPVNRSGWVPIRLIRQGGEGWVDWCWLGDARFTEPFFDLTVEAAQRRPFNTLFTHRTPLGELGRWYDESPGMAPAGFIFHMSRCGSTLISQMLAALPDNVVVSEAAPLDRIARADWLPEATRAPGLRWMVSALGQRRLGCETRYFIKFDSATAVALPFLRRVFPDVPWTFVIRDPEEVLISHLRDPAAAMSPGMITDVNLVGVPPHEARSLSPEEYAARAIGRLCDCAVAGMDERGLVVNYTELPDVLWGGVARHFGIEFSAEERARMEEVAGFHAKRPRQKFRADGESKRLEVSDTVREAAERWIGPGYRELERIRAGIGKRF